MPPAYLSASVRIDLDSRRAFSPFTAMDQPSLTCCVPMIAFLTVCRFFIVATRDFPAGSVSGQTRSEGGLRPVGTIVRAPDSPDI